MLRKSVLLLLLFFSPVASALDLRATTSAQDNLLAFSAETASIQVKDGSLQGNGVRVEFSHAVTPKWVLETFLSTALSGTSSSFTGFGGYVTYSLFSSCCQQDRKILVDNTTVIDEYRGQNHVFQVGAGLNQYFLNGSAGVYSSSGPGVELNYLFHWSKWQFKASARMAQMTISQSAAQGTFLTFGLVFPL